MRSGPHTTYLQAYNSVTLAAGVALQAGFNDILAVHCTLSTYVSTQQTFFNIKARHNRAWDPRSVLLALATFPKHYDAALGVCARLRAGGRSPTRCASPRGSR